MHLGKSSPQLGPGTQINWEKNSLIFDSKTHLRSYFETVTYLKFSKKNISTVFSSWFSSKIFLYWIASQGSDRVAAGTATAATILLLLEIGRILLVIQGLLQVRYGVQAALLHVVPAAADSVLLPPHLEEQRGPAAPSPFSLERLSGLRPIMCNRAETSKSLP